jgi:hypothetical protein
MWARNRENMQTVRVRPAIYMEKYVKTPTGQSFMNAQC